MEIFGVKIDSKCRVARVKRNPPFLNSPYSFSEKGVQTLVWQKQAKAGRLRPKY